WLSDARKRDSIPSTPVGPGLLDIKAGIFEKSVERLESELVAVLGVNRFSSYEIEINVGRGNLYVLLASALQMHLDARLHTIPECAMAKAGGIKIRAELSIQAIQDVQVECCRNLGTVIVCGNESGFLFHHICP